MLHGIRGSSRLHTTTRCPDAGDGQGDCRTKGPSRTPRWAARPVDGAGTEYF